MAIIINRQIANQAQFVPIGGGNNGQRISSAKNNASFVPSLRLNGSQLNPDVKRPSIANASMANATMTAAPTKQNVKPETNPGQQFVLDGNNLANYAKTLRSLKTEFTPERQSLPGTEAKDQKSVISPKEQAAGQTEKPEQITADSLKLIEEAAKENPPKAEKRSDEGQEQNKKVIDIQSKNQQEQRLEKAQEQSKSERLEIQSNLIGAIKGKNSEQVKQISSQIGEKVNNFKRLEEKVQSAKAKELVNGQLSFFHALLGAINLYKAQQAESAGNVKAGAQLRKEANNHRAIAKQRLNSLPETVENKDLRSSISQIGKGVSEKELQRSA